MEWISSMNNGWKLLYLGTLLVWLFLHLFFDKTQQILSLSTARNTAFQLSSFKFLDQFAREIKPKQRQQYQSLNSKKIKTIVKKTCNMFDGEWVFKPDENPKYDSMTCPFIEEKLSCKRNGRPDFGYEKWRWEPSNCDIPIFNGVNMMEKLRNKRMIFVGDSLNRNMWESLACLLYTSISSSRAQVQAQGSQYKVLQAKDYNFTIEFYWSPFLIEFNEKHKSGKKVLILDKISPNSGQWRGANIMVFNSGHWWAHSGKFKSWDLLQYGEEITEEMQTEVAYKRAMKTWANWVMKNVDLKETTVFFRSISAEHKMRNYNQWCYNVTQPMIKQSYVSAYPNSLVKIIETLIKNMQINYLNITKLSEYRIDAHPSIYRNKDWKIRIKKFQENLSSYADCSHWCLPGVPDTWNRLLYAFIMSEIS